ncbi:MAG TPA: adenosylmethionine--8-amino-7-oxononanoate transaminase [Mycobacteriales bacterium]|nr:adenosylmethionine--8-amino-7-oxononanoate transaminase [Mycobacteriales bacterium]
MQQLDAQHVWHPYAPFSSLTPYVVTGAKGVRLRLHDGTRLVDGMSSWWAAIHGYRHPALDAALTNQLGQMAHVMFGGLTHEPAVLLAQRLADVSPAGLECVFFSDSGSVAVEIATKMALQYWQARQRPSKTRLLALRGGYHGDTFMAMSLCDPVNGMHHLFSNALAGQLFAPAPPMGVDRPIDATWVSTVEAMLAERGDEVAAVIAEPVVQGAGGMRMYDPAYVTVLRELCDRHDVLLILDEIATGFGRTGSMFAAEAARVSPDIMCIGKALTAGYMSFAGTVTTEAVAQTVSDGPAGALLHGPTYMANPLACSVALANLDLLAQRDWRAEVRDIEAGLQSGLAPARELPEVADVRVLGAIGVVQMHAPVNVAAATEAAVERGVWLRPFRDLIYTMPPYISTAADVAVICDGVLAAVKASTAP